MKHLRMHVSCHPMSLMEDVTEGHELKFSAQTQGTGRAPPRMFNCDSVLGDEEKTPSLRSFLYVSFSLKE